MPEFQNDKRILEVYTSAWEPDGAFELKPGEWEIYDFGVLFMDDDDVWSILPWHVIQKTNLRLK